MDTPGRRDVDETPTVSAVSIGLQATGLVMSVTFLASAVAYATGGAFLALVAAVAVGAASIAGASVATIALVSRQREKHLTHGRPSVDDMSVRDLELLELYSHTEGVL